MLIKDARLWEDIQCHENTSNTFHTLQITKSDIRIKAVSLGFHNSHLDLLTCFFFFVWYISRWHHMEHKCKKTHTKSTHSKDTPSLPSILITMTPWSAQPLYKIIGPSIIITPIVYQFNTPSFHPNTIIDPIEKHLLHWMKLLCWPPVQRWWSTWRGGPTWKNCYDLTTSKEWSTGIVVKIHEMKVVNLVCVTLYSK